MRFRRRDPWPAAPEFEHIARFGGAQIVRDWSDRIAIRYGTAVAERRRGENQAP